MNLANLKFVANLEASSKDEAIKHLVNIVARKEECDTIIQRLIAREKVKITAKNKLALPHAIFNGDDLYIAVATLAKPLMWETEPVDIICLVVCPNRLICKYLLTCITLAKVLSDSNIKLLIKKSDSDDAIAIITAAANILMKRSNP
jgi:mannitol/fructose-specific phosphotransferase system IIA component (Ntr-type)